MTERIRRPTNSAEWQQIDEELASEKNEIIEIARVSKAAYDAVVPELRNVLKLLKAEREAQGLSVAEIASRSGLTQSQLSQLENDPEPNPTLATLRKYASVLGKKLTVTLTDQCSPA